DSREVVGPKAVEQSTYQARCDRRQDYTDGQAGERHTQASPGKGEHDRFGGRTQRHAYADLVGALSDGVKRRTPQTENSANASRLLVVSSWASRVEGAGDGAIESPWFRTRGVRDEFRKWMVSRRRGKFSSRRTFTKRGGRPEAGAPRRGLRTRAPSAPA